MKGWFVVRFKAAIAAAASLTGKRFGLLVASSLVATSAIVAAGMTSGSSGLSPLASSLLGRSLAADQVPVEAAAPEVEETESEASEPVETSSEPETAPEVETEFAPEPAPEPEPEPEPEEEAKPEEPEPEIGPVKHVFVVSLASSGYDAAFGATPQMPYLATTLRPQGDLLSNFKLLDETALPNSIAAISGQPPNSQTKADCPTYTEIPASAAVSKKGVVSGSGCVYPVSTLTIADQVYSIQFKWKAYLEGMADPTTGAPANCVHPEPEQAETPVLGGYSAKLNPFVYFHSLLDLGDCSTNDLPSTSLEKDLKKVETTPNYVYVSPNLCNAGFSGQCAAGAPEGAAAADAYLANLVPKILASPAFKTDGLLIVTFNSVNPVPNPDPALPPTPATDLKTGTLLVSPFITPGSTDGTAYDPYTLLRTVEDFWGFTPLANAGATKTRSLASQLASSNGGD
ncbi:MAG TPA: alkaline phosphatase family protein [Solirubrobacterales bacterium]|nr:alkaline phosphatase family protein [Solirubrobacterales bacterium]